MFDQIKKKVERQLRAYPAEMERLHSLNRISPLLFKSIREFILRPGKRIRPILFIIGYKGYGGREPSGLYRSALALELLHDFMLIHDDIIDKSELRRGKPSMHALLGAALKKHKGLKFNGQDLGIVAGDIVYAMAIYAFLAVKENPLRKEKALRLLTEAAFYTGSGEFIELLTGTKDIGRIKYQEILRVYDLKTANYTFASPLAIGAALAGVKKREIKKIYGYGTCLGQAFQIKDDIIGMFADSKKIGKSGLTDLREAKKTLLLAMAYRLSGAAGRDTIRKALSKKKVTAQDLAAVRRVAIESGALEAAKKEIRLLLEKARQISKNLKIKPAYKKTLEDYSTQVLKV